MHVKLCVYLTALAMTATLWIGCSLSGADDSPTGISQAEQDSAATWDATFDLGESQAPEPTPLTMTTDVVEKCKGGAEITVSNRYYLTNNQWNWQMLNPDLSWSCVWHDRGNDHVGMRWCVASGKQTGIKAFIALTSGCRWGNCSNTSDMPLKMSKDVYVSCIIEDITYTDELAHLALTDAHNIVMEFWIDVGPTKEGKYALEMMVHLVDHNMRPDERDIEEVGVQNGVMWYYKPNGKPDGETPFINFYPEKQLRGVTNLNLKPLAQFAINKGAANGNWHYHVIMFGCELICGEGEVELSHYYYGTSPESNPPQVPDWPTGVTSVAQR